MIRADDVTSLTEFQRKTRDHIKRLKRTGRPTVLTVNGQAEVVVQDARSYQDLVDRAAMGEERERLRRSIAEYRAGRFCDLDDALTDLEAKHPDKPAAARKKRAV